MGRCQSGSACRDQLVLDGRPGSRLAMVDPWPVSSRPEVGTHYGIRVSDREWKSLFRTESRECQVPETIIAYQLVVSL